MYGFWLCLFFRLVRVAVKRQDKAESRIPWVPIRSSSPDTICRLHFQCVLFCQLRCGTSEATEQLILANVEEWRLIINLLIEIAYNLSSGGAKVKKYWCKKTVKKSKQKQISAICRDWWYFPGWGGETTASLQREGRGDVYHSVEQRRWPVLDCGELDMPGVGELPRGSLSTPSVQTRQGWRTGGHCLMIWCLRWESGLARI